MSAVKSAFAQLKEQQDQPERQAALALELLRTQEDSQLMVAALRVLVDRPYRPARETLISLYQDISANGEINDPGGEKRSLILGALRQIAHRADSDLFEDAALTYEFLPPAFREESGPLRAAAIVGLNDFNDEAARFHAARILVEKYSDPMSGEPAVTAARVLASQDQVHNLYQYLYQVESELLPEVASECLRLLITVPSSLIPALIERFSQSKNDLILAGLFELLVNHHDGPFGQEFILSFMKESDRYDLYRYLVALVVAESRKSLLPLILPFLKFERDSTKARILIELLGPFEIDDDIAAILKYLKSVERR